MSFNYNQTYEEYLKKKKKKKIKKAAIIVSLACAGVISVGSIGLASQGFQNWDWLTGNEVPKAETNITLHSGRMYNCFVNPFNDIKVGQNHNGTINVSTDGHAQLGLLDDMGFPIVTSSAFDLSCFVDFQSNGYVGFSFPVDNADFPYKAIGVYLYNQNGVLNALAYGLSHIGDSRDSSNNCMSENTILARAKIPNGKNIADISFRLASGSQAKFVVRVNGSLVNWQKVDEDNTFISDNGTLCFDTTLVLGENIYLDVAEVKATIDGLYYNVSELNLN